MRKSSLPRWSRVKSAAAAAVLGLSAWSSAAWAGGQAVFDIGTGTLTVPELRFDASTTITDLVVRFLSYGELRLNDPGVGADVEYLASANVLRIPALLLDGVTYPAVSLTGPDVQIISYGGIHVDSGAGGSYTLVVGLTAMGTNMGEVARIENVPKPANQGEFCGEANLQTLRDAIAQQSSSTGATLVITGCSFDGTSGEVAATVTMSGFPVPYVATYRYE